MYRMPVSFGPAPGPRNLPEEHRHRRYEKDVTSLSVSMATDAALLAAMLPAGFELEGEARIEVTVSSFRNIGWLAGRGYDILMVRIPARWRGEEDVAGDFVPVVWENMADPVITGRDELGWSKLYSEIDPARENDGRWEASASWDGFRYFGLEAGDFSETGEDTPSYPMMFRKYSPRTGHWGEADVEYSTVTGADGPPPRIHSTAKGRGRFGFHRARWEDMPTQYPIVSALAALPLDKTGPAVLVEASGGGDGRGQRILR